MAQANSATPREPSMEEILASIRRIIEDGEAVKPAERQVTPEKIQTVEIEDEDPEPEIEAFRHELSDRSPPGLIRTIDPDLMMQEMEAEDIIAEPLFPKRSVADAHALEASDFNGYRSAPPPVVNRDELAGEARLALMSDQPGRKVAAAFGELTEAFVANRRRSFDEIAEEMIRPMLQDWLDNNLPHLVERLVREEIERIARGGSR